MSGSEIWNQQAAKHGADGERVSGLYRLMSKFRCRRLRVVDRGPRTGAATGIPAS
jgi:hypothetical protein